jgi:type IV pilus assembly protein PilM
LTDRADTSAVRVRPLLLRRSRVIGLDLGASGIRAAEIEQASHGQPARVVRVAEIDLPRGVIDHGTITDPRAVAKALRTLWRRGRFSTRRVIWGIDPASVLTRQMDLPWMEPADFASALRYQIDDALPVDVRTVEVDYHLLQEMGSSPQGFPEVNRVLVVATANDGVLATARVLRKAGLHPIAADTHAFGLIRSAGLEREELGPELIVDIGAEQLTMVIHRAGTPELIRSVSHVAGAAADLAIAAELDLAPDTAESEKIRVGVHGPAPVLTPIPESSVFADSLPHHGALAIDTAADPRTDQIIGLLGRWAATVIKEITDSIDYFSTLAPGNAGNNPPIQRIVIVGRGGRVDGLAERIATQTRLPVDFLEPLDEFDARFACAIGLGLNDGPRVDLMPASVTRSLRMRAAVTRGAVAAGVIAVGMAGLWWMEGNAVATAEQKVAALTAQNATISNRIDALAPVGVLSNELTQAQELVADTVSAAPRAVDVLSRLRAAAAGAGDIQFATINTTFAGLPQPGSDLNRCPNPDPFTTDITIGCLSFTAEGPDRAAVAALVANLEADDYFVGAYVNATTLTSSVEGQGQGGAPRVVFSGTVGVTPAALVTAPTDDELQAISTSDPEGNPGAATS